MDILEEEDLLYLDFYLDGKDSCPNVIDFPITWSPISEGTSPSYAVESSSTDQAVSLESHGEQNDLSSRLQNSHGSANDEDCLPGLRSVRRNKGIPKARFVTYQSFPPVRGKPCICELCGEKLATKESHRRHVLSRHVKERPHECDVCGKSFIFRFSLKSHKAIHSDTAMFVCVCGMSFKLRTSYMNHIQRIHRAASETKYTCELCFKSFGERHTLRLHMVSVHKPKTIPCKQEGCNKVFSSISLMRCHYRYHLNKKYTCDQCGQIFSTESYMQKHSLTHTGVRPYTCLDCGKTYLSASHRNQHRRLCHSPSRTFQCSFCGKCFKSKDQLKYHENNHRGEKPFKCEVCGYATAYRNTYYAHRKKHQSTSSPSDDKIATSTSDQIEGLKRKDSSRNKNKYRKGYPPVQPKADNNKNSVSVDARKSEARYSGNLKSSCIVASTSSSSSSSLSSACITKPTNMDLIIFPPNVINCSEQLGECLIDNSLQQSVKCPPTSVVREVPLNRNGEAAEHSKKDSITTKESLGKNVLLDTEKTSDFMILSSIGKCTLSECESTDDSLLLVKIADSSLGDVYTYHTISDQMEVSDLVLNSVENLNLTTVNSKCLGTDLTTCENAITINSPDDEVPTTQSLETSIDNQEVLMVLPSKSDKNADSVLQSTLFTECSQSHANDSIALPLTQAEGIQSSSNVCHTDAISPVVEIDSGMSSISSHIIDDSFRLAQMEVICPLCDEQFFCMDTYITHLECSHS